MRTLVKNCFKPILILSLALGSFIYGVGVGVYHWPPYYMLKSAKESSVSGSGSLFEQQNKEQNHHLSQIEDHENLKLPEFASTSEFEKWQQEHRAAFIDRMLYPYPGLVEFKMTASIAGSGFRKESYEVTYKGSPLFRYFRLIPEASSLKKSGRFPVILAFMGHGDVQQLIEDGHSYQHAFASDFVKAGYLVYVMENIGMQEGNDFHLALDHGLRLEGRSWYSLLFAHQRMMLDRVFSDEDADPKRVGSAGVSTGGLLALTAAAQEPRVIATSVQGIFGSMRVSFIKDRRKHCSCGNIVGLLPDFDLPVLALLVAPRFIHISNGKHDGFSPEEARRSLLSIEDHFKKFNFPAPEFTMPSGGHEFDISSAMDFFEKRLK